MNSKRRTKFYLLSLFTTLFALSMQAQPVLIEKVQRTPAPDDITIDYAKYRLPNGLTVIIHEDHSDPIVHVDVTYHVGSAREEIGRSGFAHFFEHMMFQGSKHVGDDEHFKIISGAGGTMNGTTNRDRTNYFETVPKNYLETALWLEADRMGFLLEAVSQKKFEVQRATVKNEKGQNYENRPYGMAGEITYKNLYPFGHPYSWSTIGYVEDLDRADVEDLRKFFLRWYGPNNAVLTVGGDVKTEEVLKLAEKYFGPIPAGPAVEKMKTDFFTLEKARYISYEDNVRFPMLRVTYPSVPNYHDDEAALDILAEILGQGKSSLLYQNFVKSGKALNASTGHPCTELAGEFIFSVQAFAGTKLSDMEALLKQTLDEFARRGVTDLDLEKAKNKRKAESIYALESVSGKVSILAAYETFLGDPNFIRKDLQRYEAVTKNDVMRVFETYIRGQKPLYLSVVPKGKKELIAAPDNHKAGGDSSKVVHSEYSDLKLREVKDNFNRSRKPKVGSSPVVTPPKILVENLPTGLKTVTTYNTEVPALYMKLNVKAGQWAQPKGKEGIAYLLGKMLEESSMHLTGEQKEDEADKLGTSISVYTTDEDIVITMRTLTEKLMPSLGLFNEYAHSPKFLQEEFDRVKKKQLEDIANLANRADAMATAAFSELVYGKEHPLGTYILGTTASVNSITVEDVKAYYEKHFRTGNMRLTLSGDLHENNRRDVINFMMGYMPGEETKLTFPATPAAGKTKIYLVDKEKAPQSEIRVGYMALPYDATGDYYKATIMNYVLGGAFNSRINMNLREDKGYTYGARSLFSGGHLSGPFMVYTGVRANATDSAVREILKEIENYKKDGITKQELEFTKKSILEREALKYETNSQKAGYAERIMEYGLSEDYVAEQASILKKMKRKDVNKLAQKYLPLDNMIIVVVGDADAHRENLKKLGLEVVDVPSGTH